MAHLVMRCGLRDLVLPLELGIDLPVEGYLVVFNAQEEVGPLLRELSNSTSIAYCYCSSSYH